MQKIAIIGMGPRGLTMLERLLEHAQKIPASMHLHVDVVDPSSCGEGSHAANQPDHLLVNTVASQITMFGTNSIAGGGATGLSLTEWAREEGYRRYGRQFLCIEETIGAGITDADHLPRKLLGSYLAWYYDTVVAKLPRNVTVTHHRTSARDVEELDDGLRIALADGSALISDYVMLTTGHGRRKASANDIAMTDFVAVNLHRNKHLAYLPTPYPIERLSNIAPDAVVGVQGLGLTSHDVISALTLGRGGKYSERDGVLTYHPSGREPRIRIFSRSCLPFATRGINQKGLAGKHQAQFFTPAAVQAIRQHAVEVSGDARIDFKSMVLPLIVKEMAYAYRCTESMRCIEPSEFVLDEPTVRIVERILWPLKDRSFSSAAEYRQFFVDWVEEDLKQAEMGNLTSPLKAATDVLRDTREAFRTAVEYCGLTPESHRYFLEEFNGIVNRISFGPPLRRNRELLALLKAGQLDLGGGPGAMITLDDSSARFVVETGYGHDAERAAVDVVIDARLDSYSPLTDSSELSANLLRRGFIRPLRNGSFHPGGIDIDKRLRPIGSNGAPHGRIWAAGFLVEGAHYYTHALPRPAMASRQIADAETCILQVIELVATAAQEAHMMQDEAEAA